MQQRYRKSVRIIVSDAQGDVAPPSLVSRIAASVIGAIALFVVFMFSVVALAVVSVIILIAVGYLWWKTRDLRRQLRENPPDGRVIEGDAIRDRD